MNKAYVFFMDCGLDKQGNIIIYETILLIVVLMS